MTTDERPPAQRLLAAAEELFGERSYNRTAVADICARAGMATGSFYAYYGSKAEIFAAVVRGINADLRNAMKAALEKTDGGQRTRERECFRVYFEMVSKRPWMDRIVRESEFVAPGLFREYYEHLARGYGRGVRAAQLAGEVDARYDPEVVAYAYTGIGNFVGMRWAEWTAGGQVPEDVLDDVLELLGAGARTARREEPALAASRQGTIMIGTSACRARLTATEPTTRCMACEELPTTIATVSPGCVSRSRAAVAIRTSGTAPSPRAKTHRSSRPRSWSRA